MSRRPAVLKKPKEDQAPLLTALQFVSAAQNDVGEIYQTHCVIRDGWLKAFNGKLTIAAKITEDIVTCPHTVTFSNAIARSGASFKIVQQSDDKLAVSGPNGFRAFVPCLADPQSIPNIPPDAPIASLNSELVKALAAVHPIVADEADRIVDAAIVLRSGSAVACDGKLALEYWHGIDMPPLLIPKAAALALIKCGKEPVSFGFSQASLTFHFADESWIRTQLFVDPYPIGQIDTALNSPSNPWPLPANFYEAVRAVQKFSENNTTYLLDGKVRSHRDEGVGASFDVSGIPNRVAYNTKFLLLIEPYMERVDLQGRDNIGYFFSGDKIRGLICQKSML